MVGLSRRMHLYSRYYIVHIRDISEGSFPVSAFSETFVVRVVRRIVCRQRRTLLTAVPALHWSAVVAVLSISWPVPSFSETLVVRVVRFLGDHRRSWLSAVTVLR